MVIHHRPVSPRSCVKNTNLLTSRTRPGTLGLTRTDLLSWLGRPMARDRHVNAGAHWLPAHVRLRAPASEPVKCTFMRGMVKPKGSERERTGARDPAVTSIGSSRGGTTLTPDRPFFQAGRIPKSPCEVRVFVCAADR